MDLAVLESSDHPLAKCALRAKAIIDRLTLIKGSLENQADILSNITGEALQAYVNLTKADMEKDIQYTAFALRNLLELVVWTAYCVTSKENAERFRQDAARDAVDMVRAVEALSQGMHSVDLTESISKAKLASKSFASTAGIEEDDNRFYSVSEAAKIIGPTFGLIYRSLNKVLSKVVHPTAMLVKSPRSLDPPPGLTASLLELGNGFLEAIMKSIENALPDLEVS